MRNKKEGREREKLAEMQQKCRQRELKRKENAVQKSTRSGDKVKNSEDDHGPQNRKSDNNKCTVCFGCHKDDFSPDGTLLRSWVQCRSVECGVWSVENGCTKTVSLGMKM